MRTLVRPLRLLLALLLWSATLYFLVTGLGRLATIFTGDDTFGAYDGFQITGALYGAAIKLVLATLCGFLVWRVLRSPLDKAASRPGHQKCGPQAAPASESAE